VLLAIAKALDPTGRALPKWRADNTNNWCKEWLAEKGCSSESGRLVNLDISQAGLRAAAPLHGTLPRQLPFLLMPFGYCMCLAVASQEPCRHGCCRWHLR
jgi:hypothetical protein